MTTLSFAKSLVELFKGVGYHNDHMFEYNATDVPYGFNDIGGTFETDGDLGSLTADGTIWMTGIINSTTLVTADYPYMITRGCSGGAGWKMYIKFTDDSETISPNYTDSSLVTHAWSLDTGSSISSLGFYGATPATIDYVIVANTVPLTLSVFDMTIEKGLTDEISIADFTIDYPISGYSGDESWISNHIKIWLHKEPDESEHKEFCGRVNRINKPFIGKVPRKMEFSCEDYGQYLNYTKVKKGNRFGRDTFSTVVKSIVNTLVVQGLITTSDITEAGPQVVRVARSDEVMREMLMDACEDYDFEFYVNPVGNLKLFKRGTSTVRAIPPNKMEYNYEEDGSRIINSQQIVGGPYKQLGDDTQYAESASSWSTDGAGIDAVTLPVWEGAYSIKASISTGTNHLYMERTIHTDHQDLSLGGVACFGLQYSLGEKVSSQYSPPPAYKFCWYLMEDNNNYFYQTIEVSGQVQHRQPDPRFEQKGVPVLGNTYYAPYANYRIPFNWMGAVQPSVEGTPHWDNITKFRIKTVTPDRSSGSIETIYIDNFRFEEVRVSNLYEDNTSIQNYGKREGMPIPPLDYLQTDDDCEFIGSVLVAIYKNPLPIVSDVIVSSDWDYELGDQGTLVLEETNATVEIRKITHEVNALELKTILGFSPRYIPTQERLWQNMRRQLEVLNWDLQAWKNAYIPEGVFQPRADMLEFWELSEDVGRRIWFDGEIIPNALNWCDTFGTPPSNDKGAGWISIWTDDSVSRWGGFKESKEIVSHTLESGFRCRIKSSMDPTDGRIEVLIGDRNDNHYGLQFYKGTLWGVAGTIVTARTSLEIATYNTFYTGELQVDYYPDVTNAKCSIDFLENNIYIGAVSSTLPTGTLELAEFSLDNEMGGNTVALSMDVYSFSIAKEWE